MKTVKQIFFSAVLFFFLTFSATAQTDAKVITVINKADWCSVCKTNGDRAMATFMGNNGDGEVLFVGNNLTDDNTKKKSAEELKKYGLDKVMEKHTGTGVAYFFNPETKELISKISVAKSDSKLAEALSSAKAEVN